MHKLIANLLDFLPLTVHTDYNLGEGGQHAIRGVKCGGPGKLGVNSHFVVNIDPRKEKGLVLPLGMRYS